MSQRRGESERSVGGIEVAPGVRLADEAVQIRFSRSGGPGGQNVNKLSTRAELRVPLQAIAEALGDEPAVRRLVGLCGSRLTREGVIQLFSQEFRSQEGNRAEVLAKLRDLIVEARKAPRPRKATRPSKSAKRRRVDEKKHRGQIKARRQGREE
jgi:ribosome-associated protein